MKLCLLLCLSFVPWSQGRKGVQRTTPQPQTQPRPLTQPLEDPPLNCSHMESLKAAHERERMPIPTGDKFDVFDWRLIKELNAAEKGNIVISPVSLKVVLSMLYEGANGTTARELGEALDIHNDTLEERRHSRKRFSRILQSLQTSEDDYKIKMGTHAFIDQTTEVNMNYQCKLKTYYNSDIVKVDFSNPSVAVKEINNWAKNVTEGHIQDLISESEAQSSTIMLLLNAVYFKGLWEIPFTLNQTKPGDFHLDDKKTVKVPFMNVTDRFGYYDMRDIGARMIELPYRGNKFSMYVLLPYSPTGLDDIAKALGPERSLRGIIGNMMPTIVNLIMPKFEFDFTTKLRPTLEKLGIKTMFSSEAELTDIAKTKSSGLMVSNVLQKAGISVTEAGTVAYAATSLDLVDKFGASEETVDFVVDRPFLFFIEEIPLRTTVFVGKVTNPDSAKVVSIPQEAPAKKPTGESESDTVVDRLSTNGQSGNKVPSTPPAPIEQTTQSRFNFFDGELLQAVGKEVQGNFVLSPASVKTLLGLILAGADERTHEEIKEMLRLPTNSVQAHQIMASLQDVLQKLDTSQVVVDSETNAFLADDLMFNRTYVKVVSDLYKADTTDVNFKSPESAANKINGWVLSRTRGKISSIIAPDEIDPETMMILVNTVYFDAKWKEEFLMKNTNEECFYSEPNYSPCIKVPIMYKKEELNYKFDKDFNSHVVQIPYLDGRFSMVLVVPAAVDGIKRIARDINKLTFPKLLEKTSPTEVHLKLPRFSVEHESDLKPILTKMGLNTVFTNEAKLPFMINNKQARVTSVIHKAKIEVTEKGTKAAAVSGAAVVPLMSGNDAVIVTADHPFYYFIYEGESRTVLFSGRISSLSGVAGTDENMEGLVGAISLSSNELGIPQGQSYAEAVNSRPASSPRPQFRPPSRQPVSSNTPANNGPQHLGPVNQPYSTNGRTSTNSPQHHSSTTPHSGDIGFPDPNQESTNDDRYKYKYFENKDSNKNFHSQQRS